jgi:hypothetical protein
MTADADDSISNAWSVTIRARLWIVNRDAESNDAHATCKAGM